MLLALPLAMARGAFIFIHILLGLGTALGLRTMLGPEWYIQSPGRLVVRNWMRVLGYALGLSMNVYGSVARNTCVLVANHISWLDVVVIGSLYPASFIAKAEVQKWPLLGRLAELSGTLFIQRGNRSSLAEVKRRAQRRLLQNQHLVFFPEGTTTRGQNTKPFKPGLFQMSLDTRCATQAIALRYPHEDRDTPSHVPYVDDDHFVAHLWRLIQQPKTRVDVHFCPPINHHAHRCRNSLADSARRQIDKVLTLSEEFC